MEELDGWMGPWDLTRVHGDWKEGKGKRRKGKERKGEERKGCEGKKKRKWLKDGDNVFKHQQQIKISIIAKMSINVHCPNQIS